MHVWHGTHAGMRGLPWWRVRVAGSWRLYRRKVLWVGNHYVGIQGKRSRLGKI